MCEEMIKNPYRRVWACVNLDALHDNLRQIAACRKNDAGIIAIIVPANVNGIVTRIDKLAIARVCLYVTFLSFSNALIMSIIIAAVSAAIAITSTKCVKNPAAICPAE